MLTPACAWAQVYLNLAAREFANALPTPSSQLPQGESMMSSSHGEEQDRAEAVHVVAADASDSIGGVLLC